MRNFRIRPLEELKVRRTQVRAAGWMWKTLPLQLLQCILSIATTLTRNSSSLLDRGRSSLEMRTRSSFCSGSLRGQRFHRLEEVKSAAGRVLNSINRESALEGIQKLPHRWNRVIELEGDYIEGWLYSYGLLLLIIDYMMYANGLLKWPSYLLYCVISLSHVENHRN